MWWFWWNWESCALYLEGFAMWVNTTAWQRMENLTWSLSLCCAWHSYETNFPCQITDPLLLGWHHLTNWAHLNPTSSSPETSHTPLPILTLTSVLLYTIKFQSGPLYLLALEFQIFFLFFPGTQLAETWSLWQKDKQKARFCVKHLLSVIKCSCQRGFVDEQHHKYKQVWFC